ncbi:MAG: hypothetical protein AAFS04_03410, partial [Cyanobacteria bacterium J06631_9]
ILRLVSDNHRNQWQMPKSLLQLEEAETQVSVHSSHHTPLKFSDLGGSSFYEYLSTFYEYLFMSTYLFVSIYGCFFFLSRFANAA